MAFPWKKTLIGGGAVMAILAGATVLSGFAGGCHGHGHGHGRDPAAMAAAVTKHVDELLDEVDATPAQRKKVHEIKDRLLASARQAHDAHDADRAALLAAWRSPNPDRAALLARVDARIDAMRAFAHQAVDGALELHATLTPEQREQVAKKVERRMGR
jgi:periplasmic protein CpxP/Spy